MKIKELTTDPTQNSLHVVTIEATVAEMIDFFHSLKEINDEFTCEKTENHNEVVSIVKYGIPEECKRVYEALKEKFAVE